MKSFQNLLIFILLTLLIEMKSVSPFHDTDHSRSKIMFPGTKWCGAGNISEHFDDLGDREATDKCCREHDLCPDIIKPKESKYGLNNDADYTRLSCDCDNVFRHCLLKNIRETKYKTSSATVGFIYFKALKTRCFKLEHKVVNCKKRTKFLKRCKEYELDMKSEKIWQWFEVTQFKDD